MHTMHSTDLKLVKDQGHLEKKCINMYTNICAARCGLGVQDRHLTYVHALEYLQTVRPSSGSAARECSLRLCQAVTLGCII